MEFIDLKTQYQTYQEELEAAALRVLRSGRYILGPEVAELEGKLARFVKRKYALGVSSGTDGLLIILTALGIGPGDAVITTPFTFAATAEVIRRCGAQVVFADISEKTMTLTPMKVKEALQKAKREGLLPKAILAVGLFGLPAYLPELEELASSEGLFLIEDACQSLGAMAQGRPSGSFGIAAATSFFPAKPLGGYGDGGMIFTSNFELYERMKALRVHGQTERYQHRYIGFNARLDTFQAALLLVKFKYFPAEIEQRQIVAKRYRQGLKDLPLSFQEVPAGYLSTYAQFTVCVRERDALQAYLKKRGIPTAIYYPKPLHLQPAFEDLGYQKGDFPVAESLAQNVISLPMHPFLSAIKQDFIIKSIRKFYGD